MLDVVPAAAASGPKTRIVLVEGHAILRDGLRTLLELERDLTVAGSVGDAASALQVVREVRPDLVISDVSLPDRSGIALIGELLLTFRGLRLLVLTAHGTEEYIRAALNAGAHGYVVKDSGRADLLRAIRTVMSGRQYLCASVAAKVVSGFVSGFEARRTTPVEDLVTGRERQVLTCVALGQSNKSIARDLGLSVKTVEKHRANLMRKLTLHNAAAVTLFALRHGLIEADAIDPAAHSPR
jgi:two-component system, NarL family, response regulator NreC